MLELKYTETLLSILLHYPILPVCFFLHILYLTESFGSEMFPPISNWDIKVAMYWTHLLFIKLIHIPFKMFNLLLPRLVYLMSWWPLTVCLSWCRLIDSLLLLIRLPASLAPQLPCWIDDGLVPPTASPPFTMFDGYWSVTHWSSLLFLPLWWFIASRWEYHYWHHPIGPFLWEEREGRAHIWWLLQVLENIQWTP